MKKLLIIRHCQSVAHIDRSAGPNSHLSELGKQQAAATADRLKKELAGQAVALISSDLHRAWETAAPIGDALGVEPTAEPALREWRGKVPAQMTPDEKHRMEADHRWFLFDWPEGPDVESWRMLYNRVDRLLESLSESLSPNTLPILVSHGGTMSNIVASWLRIPVDALPARTPFTGAPASITVLAKNEFDEPYLERLSDCTHLPDLSLKQALA